LENILVNIQWVRVGGGLVGVCCRVQLIILAGLELSYYKTLLSWYYYRF